MNTTRSFHTVRPSDGTRLETYAHATDADTDHALERAADAFRSWRRTSFPERAELLRSVADLLREREDRYAFRMAEEMGKPVSEGRAECEKCAWVCEYYAEEAEGMLAPDELDSDGTRARVVYRPLGPVLAVMPWNFPFWQVFRFAAPALMAGNVALLKHADGTAGCALDLQELFTDAGAPEGVFTTVFADHDQAARMIGDDRIVAVTLTGSGRAGREVAARAGQALKKTVLELGGSDPYVILEDADPAEAAEICVNSRLINSGQSCIAAKRWITTPGIHEAFVEEAVNRMREVRPGDPHEADTRIGPMAREDLRDTLHRQITESVQQGATLECGGSIPERKGWWYPPTVLTGVTPGMPAADQELFGPAAAVLAAKDEADAIRLANATSFGLGAAVLTGDPERGQRIAEDGLEAGCCFVNALVKSDPRLPFGGIKQSGYGRELSLPGILEFVNQKTVYVK